MRFGVQASARAARKWARRVQRRPLRRHLRDGLGRAIEIAELEPQDLEGVLAMYRTLDPAQRAQGLPPHTEERRAIWVDELARRGPNLVARSGQRIVGHAALVPDGASHELVLFVHQEHQGAGIGGALIDAVLALARRQGAVRVWLTVERWNHRAIALYRRTGFRRVSTAEPADPPGVRSGEEIWALSLRGGTPKDSATVTVFHRESDERRSRHRPGLGSVVRIC